MPRCTDSRGLRSQPAQPRSSGPPDKAAVRQSCGNSSPESNPAAMSLAGYTGIEPDPAVVGRHGLFGRPGPDLRTRGSRSRNGSHSGSQTAQSALNFDGLNRGKSPSSERGRRVGGPARTPDRDLSINCTQADMQDIRSITACDHDIGCGGGDTPAMTPRRPRCRRDMFSPRSVVAIQATPNRSHRGSRNARFGPL
jgi:hypothetical protein